MMFGRHLYLIGLLAASGIYEAGLLLKGLVV